MTKFLLFFFLLSVPELIFAQNFIAKIEKITALESITNMTIKHGQDISIVNASSGNTFTAYPGDELSIEVYAGTNVHYYLSANISWRNTSFNTNGSWWNWINNSTNHDFCYFEKEKGYRCYNQKNETKTTGIFNFTFPYYSKCQNVNKVIPSYEMLSIDMNLLISPVEDEFISKELLDFMIFLEEDHKKYGVLLNSEGSVIQNATAYPLSLIQYQPAKFSNGRFFTFKFTGKSNTNFSESNCTYNIFVCHYSCLTCSYPTYYSNDISTTCETCNEQYIMELGNWGNCIPKIGKGNQVHTDKPFDEVSDILKENITENYNTYTGIIGNDYSIEIIKSNSPKKNNDTSSVDLDDCIKNIRHEYSIEDESPIYIIKTDKINKTTSTTYIEYEIVDEYGQAFDLFLCEPMSVNVTIPIKPNMFNETLEEEIKSRDVDIFDPESIIYNDICYSFQDLTVGERRKTLFHNLCGNCFYNGVNVDKTQIYCLCNGENFDDDNLFPFTTSVPKNNFKIVKCGNRFLDSPKLKNAGFCLILSFMLIQFILFIIYRFIEIPNLRKKYIIYPPPPPRINNLIQSISSETNLRDFTSIRSSQKNITVNPNEVEEPNIIQNISKIEVNTNTNTCKLVDNDNSEIYLNRIADYETALEKDKRNVWKIICDTLIENIVIINCFFHQRKVELVGVKLFFFFFQVSLTFLSGALFYSITMIEEKHRSDPKEYISQLFKSLFSAIICSVIGFFFGILTNYNSVIKGIKITNTKQNQNFEISRAIKRIRCKFFFFLILSLLFELFALYFCTIFCELYKDSQWSWICGGIFSVLFPIVGCLILSIISGFIRYRGIKYQKKRNFTISKWINYLYE